VSGAAWQQRPYGPNQTVLPLDDVVEHSYTERCVCKPSWVAMWGGETVTWIFVHSALDGRAQARVERAT